MVTVLVICFCAPSSDPPVGLDRVKLKVSFHSKTLSLTTGMLTVLLVSPSAKVTIIGVLL